MIALRFSFCFTCLFLCTISKAQIGVNTNSPDDGSALDIVSSDAGLLIPRLALTGSTDVSTISGGNVESLLIYNTATVSDITPGFYYWNGTSWNRLTTSGSNSNQWSLNGNAGTTNGTNFIGTTDAQDIDLRINNIIRHRFTQKSQLEFLNSGQSVYIGEEAGEASDGTNTNNAFVGYQSGLSNTGENNSFFGAQSGQNNSTGNGNSFFGYQSGQANTIGGRNSFFGTGAGVGNITGNDNTFLGENSGASNSSGVENTFIGSKSGQTSVGSENTFVGEESGKNNGMGNRNTYIGSRSGFLNSGSHNVFIGFGSGSDLLNASNTLIIQNNPNDDPLIKGRFDNKIIELKGSVKIKDVINLVPRSTPPSSPEMGDVYYDAGLNKLRLWIGSNWENLN